MSFGENLQYLRKQKNITQEELAEQLAVSRQSVSKWESDTSTPEMDKLMQICDMFQCSMDTLLRGNVKEKDIVTNEKYENHMNTFSKWISIGVGIILLGLTIHQFMRGFGLPNADTLSSIVFMFFVICAVVIIVVNGIWNEDFNKKYPVIEPFYTEEQLERFNKRFPLLIAIPIAIILIGVILCMSQEMISLPAGYTEDIFNAMLFLCVTIAVPIIVYAGTQKEKYDVEAYNRKNNPNPEVKKQNDKIGKWCACIMMLATIVFLLSGFLADAWKIAWVVYPVGGIGCGVVSVILSKDVEA